MTTLRQRPLLLGTALSAALTAWLPAAPASAESDGDVRVTNTETVQVYLSPEGKVDSQRIYEQLQLTGKGSVDLLNPISTNNLRNLDGFTGFDVKDGKQVIRTDVDGQDALRSVSDYDGDLPLKVSVEYKLDGKTVDPDDVVGEDGTLEVLYTVENVTGEPQELSFDDGHGGTVTKTVDVPIPMVATLETTAPASFDNVTSQSANMGGDGHGGTRMNFTMTLFPPIGSTKATVGYTAEIHDGVVPRAEISALPVNPLESPVFKSAATSYQGGADSGIELTGGSTLIDSNLLKLRDGASKLVSGLIQLDDGAAQLRAGLADEAAPGAARLADGAGQLDDGLGQLSDGAGRLRDGAGRLHDGTGAALDGSRRLRDGLGQISDGLGQLADTSSGLPAATAGIRQLKGGVDQILAGLGDRQDPATLIGGLNALHTGLSDAKFGSALLTGGAKALVDPAKGLPAAKAGVDMVKAGLEASGPKADDLVGALQMVKATPGCKSDPTCTGTVDAVIPQVQDTKSQLALAAAGLGQVSNGLGTAITGINGQLVPGLTKLSTGLADAESGSLKLLVGAESVDGGLNQVRKGLDQLAVGVEKAVAGVMQLDDGAAQAYTGSTDLADGLGQLDGGAGQLDDGAGQLADGARKAKDGSAQVADGAGQLSDGLQTAADGSGRLSDGLGEARSGAPKLVDGAQRLSDEGTKVLVSKGEGTAQNYGEMVAVLQAGAERAQTDDMAFGAPDDALGLTAYSFVLQGADGEGQRNLTRGLAGGALLAAAGGVLALRRRRLV